MADCFENKLQPLANNNYPQCMFPLANVPVLHYIMEFLISN